MEKEELLKFLIPLGKEYLNTRHNIGFKALDFVSTQTSAFFRSDRLGDIATYKFKGRTIFLLKPKCPYKT